MHDHLLGNNYEVVFYGISLVLSIVIATTESGYTLEEFIPTISCQHIWVL